MYFTYVLGWSRLNKYYYGVRYKDTATLESVGTTYFSSSKYVHAFILKNGNPDVVQIRRVFGTKIDAKLWEERVLTRISAAKSSRWLNRANTNAFKDIVMDDAVKQAISKAKTGKLMGKWYTDGVANVLVKPGCEPPEGFFKGRTQTEKQKAHVDYLNSREESEEAKKARGAKVSAKLKGRPKPEGFGEKISKAAKGKPKEYSRGDNNVSKRPDVRSKVSEKNKGRKHYTDGITLKFVKPEDAPEGWYKTTIKEFNDAKQI